MTTDTTNPELEQFKVQVATVARELAVQHNLCSVVDEALEKMGISTQKKQVEIVLGVSGKLVLEMDENVYSGLTEEQRIEWIRQRIVVEIYNNRLQVGVHAAGGAGASGSAQITFGKEDIEIVSVSDEITAPAPTAYLWMRGGRRGRVLHAVRADTINAAGDRYGWATSVCERATQQRYEWSEQPYGYSHCAVCESRVRNA